METKNIIDSLLEVQKNLNPIVKTTEAFKYKYAPLEVIWEKVRDVIHNAGFVVTHNIKDGKVITRAMHKDGLLESEIQIPDNLKPQDVGSAITYFKRYNTVALFNIQLEGEDDDAQTAQKAPKKAWPPVKNAPMTEPEKEFSNSLDRI